MSSVHTILNISLSLFLILLNLLIFVITGLIEQYRIDWERLKRWQTTLLSTSQIMVEYIYIVKSIKVESIEAKEFDITPVRSLSIDLSVYRIIFDKT